MNCEIFFFFAGTNLSLNSFPWCGDLRLEIKKIKNGTDENSYKTVIKETFLQEKVEKSV